jgi:hypothetical protein
VFGDKIYIASAEMLRLRADVTVTLVATDSLTVSNRVTQLNLHFKVLSECIHRSAASKPPGIGDWYELRKSALQPVD